MGDESGIRNISHLTTLLIQIDRCKPARNALVFVSFFCFFFQWSFYIKGAGIYAYYLYLLFQGFSRLSLLLWSALCENVYWINLCGGVVILPGNPSNKQQKLFTYNSLNAEEKCINKFTRQEVKYIYIVDICLYGLPIRVLWFTILLFSFHECFTFRMAEN